MGNMFELNNKQIQAMMKQMGMSQEELDASRVVIETNNGNNIIIENPHVVKLNIKGQESFQITGDVKTEEEVKFTEEDIKQVIEKTGCTKHQATEVLESTNGDIAEAILELSD
jgi:nascent polypeptide-associated complex subunit alpha